MTTEACKNCRSCVVAIEGEKPHERPSETTGYCYRYPPTVVAPNQSSYPVVKLDWWCGEFVDVRVVVQNVFCDETSPEATKAAIPKRKSR